MITHVPTWLPNAISVVRVLAVPVWVLCAELAQRAIDAPTTAYWRWLATAVLVGIGVSDVVDGWLARRFHLQSRLGATLDAIADKLVQVVLTTYLALRVGEAFPPMPWWLLALLIARDAVLLVGYLAIRARCGGVDTEHESHGRLASVGLFVLLVLHSAGQGGAVVDALAVATGLLVLLSTARYVQRGWQQVAAAA